MYADSENKKINSMYVEKLKVVDKVLAFYT